MTKFNVSGTSQRRIQTIAEYLFEFWVGFDGFKELSGEKQKKMLEAAADVYDIAHIGSYGNND